MNKNIKKSFVLRCKACDKIIQHDLDDNLCLDCLSSIEDYLIENIYDIEQEVKEVLKEF